MNGHNQYPPMTGVPELRQAVAAHDKRFYGLEVDWQSEVIVTSGATEALADCLIGADEPGDEVVLIEPLYDSYLPVVRRAGGVRSWCGSSRRMGAAARRTGGRVRDRRPRLILFNTPMNPAGKVFDRDELRLHRRAGA